MAFTQYYSNGAMTKNSFYYSGYPNILNSPTIGINSLKSVAVCLCVPKYRREANVLSAQAVWKLRLSAPFRRGTCEASASLTVEAAICLPLFLFFFLALFGYFRVMHVELRAENSLMESGKQMAEAAYAGTALAKWIDGEEGAEAADILSAGFAQARILADCPAEYRRAMRLSGIILVTENGRQEENAVLDGTIAMRGDYQVIGQGALAEGRYFRGSVSVRIWPWVGSPGAGDQTCGEDISGEMVYRTSSGEVYHTNRECSYLRLSISQVSADSLRDRRNLDGSIYRKCSQCKGSGGMVYITDYGEHYHSSLECSGLKRHVLAVKREETEGMRECRKCAGG